MSARDPYLREGETLQRLDAGQILTLVSWSYGCEFPDGARVSPKTLHELEKRGKVRRVSDGRYAGLAGQELVRDHDRELEDSKRRRLDRWAATVRAARSDDELRAALLEIASEARALGALTDPES